MRYVVVVLMLLAMPLAADAQHSPSLPSIGLPLPTIGLGPPPWEQRQLPPWERPQIPAWERKTLPPWEGGPAPGHKVDTGQRRHRRAATPAVYYVPYAVEVPRAQPQVIVVQPAPVQIIKVEVPVREPREDVPAAKEPEPPPYVPTGDRTLYVIPGCYVGNVPPQNLKLAAHCDLKKLTTYHP